MTDPAVEPACERWVTKEQLADHLGVSPRWIERRHCAGLPDLRLGGLNRYKVSAVEARLRQRHAPPERSSCR
ncbi:MAG TPA: hypothetical protein VKU89_00155 [Solirubrobacteraceae bacterium]|nr:hypothetical protein [Solirubrobacteraceae bacterium]